MTALTNRLAVVALVVAVPSIACLGYYAVEDAGPALGSFGAAVLVLAWPTTLVASAIFGILWSSPRRSRFGLWAAAAAAALPLVLLWAVRAA